MFRRSNGQYRAAKTVTEHCKVTKDEFVKFFVAAGGTPAEAEFQAKMSNGLGSEVLIGGVFYSIEEKAKK